MTVDSSARFQTKAQRVEYVLKFVVVGESNVGKSQLIRRFSEDQFSAVSSMTIGMEFVTKEISYYDNVILKSQIWDIGGHNYQKSILRAYFSGAVGALILYDVTDRQSWEGAKSLLKVVRGNSHRNIAVSLLATKVDCVESRVVTAAEGLAFANENRMDYVETSAKTGENVHNAFRRLIMTVANLLPEGRRVERKSSISSGSGLKGVDSSLYNVPTGWLKLDSALRVGEKSYENIWTGERVVACPSKAAKEYNSIRRCNLSKSIDLTGVGLADENPSDTANDSNIRKVDQNCCIS